MENMNEVILRALKNSGYPTMEDIEIDLETALLKESIDILLQESVIQVEY